MSDQVCPSCGHCKECGRGGGFRFYPYVYPSYPYGYWYGTVTTGGTVPISAASGAGGNLNGISWTNTVQAGVPTYTATK